MNGVILYADDNIFDANREENILFMSLVSNSDISVLPINSLSSLEKVITTISTYKALILDWNFENNLNDEDFEDLEMPTRTPLQILKTYAIYSLVYIYSENEIPEKEKEELNTIFGNKIKFRSKRRDVVDEDCQSIIDEISEFEESNKHMEIPFQWSQTINQSVQSIFSELECADPNWIKEIIDTANTDGADPVSEVIDVFQHILSESLIQNSNLRDALKQYEPKTKDTTLENTAKLYRRIFYSKLSENAPIMTGDIFKFNDNEYGVLITPECEIGERKKIQLEFLILEPIAFDDYLKREHSFERVGLDGYESQKERRRDNLQKLFNNDSLSSHILPSFPFDDLSYNKSACINFKTAFTIKRKEEFENKRSFYKLNSPYINQLRQKYISFFGRYGVPAIPDSLRIFNLITP